MSTRAAVRVGALALGLLTLAALVATGIIWSADGPWNTLRSVALLGLLGLTVFLSCRSLVLRTGTESQNIAPIEGVFVLALLLSPSAVLAVAIAEVIGRILRGLRTPSKIAFDLVQQLAALSSGVLVWQLLRGQAAPIEPRWALAALAGGTVSGLISVGSTLLVHRLVDAPRPRAPQVLLSMVVAPTSASFAVLTVALVGRDWRYAVVVAPLGVVIALLVRAMHRAQRRADVLARLEGIAATLVAVGDPTSVAERAVELAADMLGARRGELRAALPLGRQVRAGTSVRTADVTGRIVASLLEECGGRVLVSPGGVGDPEGPEARLRQAVGSEDVVAVSIRAREEVTGWLLVADHQLSYTFDDLDLATLGTLADYVGLALLAADTATRLRVEATTDTLTGLANRRALAERGGPVAADSGCVLLIDLDGFKDVNDTLGHAAGDELLRVVAARLTSASGPDAVVARLGGDEFAVAHPSTRDEEDLARRLRTALSAPTEISGQSITPTASVGVASGPRDGETLSELLAVADAAMYSAKEAKRTRTAS